ncbi:LytTR family transcriptional regulator DNA-binding domain-containing protein [uncultured Algoriphagus sp.]|uniref:LytTR family transcriptional regulator DNA-binding domain-containing protein n=1 Tax=uncultured Algoriphagus sp. TaxID=417365 RepID=UPI0030ECC4A8
MSQVSLTSIANALPRKFVRIHQTFIIILKHIDEVQSNKVLIGNKLYPVKLL